MDSPSRAIRKTMDISSVLESPSKSRAKTLEPVSPSRVRTTSHEYHNQQPHHESYIPGFQELSQELTVVVRRRSSEAIVDAAALHKFELELRNYHCADANKLAVHFNSSIVHGLQDATAHARLIHDGPNIADPPKDWPVWAKFIFAFFSGFAPILWVAAFLAFISWRPLGEAPSNVYNLILGIALLIVIVVSSMFTFYQELQATRILKGFETLVPSECIVVRNGHHVTVNASQLVVGDVVHLQTGSRVPSDIRVASSNGMKVDKSMLTGEAEPMRVTFLPLPETTTYLEASNMLFMGSNVVDGNGVGVVVATGKDNLLSKIVSQASGTDGITSLQVEVNRFIAIISSFAVITAIVIIMYWVFWLRTTHPGFMSLSLMLANVIGIVVAYVPDGFPLALSLGLTIIAKRLCGKYFVLAKRLGCIETIGSMTMLCSDKTGTLTQNLMSVTMLLSSTDVMKLRAERIGFSVESADQTQDATPTDDSVHGISHEVVTRNTPVNIPKNEIISSLSGRVASLCNQAKLQRVTQGADGGLIRTKSEIDLEGGADSQLVAVGSNSTDRAILNWANENASIPSLSAQYEQRALMPFSSTTKLAASVVTDNATQQTFVLVKGASEFILPLCTSYIDESGASQPVDTAFTVDLMSVLSVEADKGRRIIMLAQYDPLNAELFPANYEFTTDPTPNFPTDNLTFVSCVVVSDPPRPNVDVAIGELRTAGILVAMVTGDSPSTAIAISSQIGIVTCPSKEVETLATFETKQAAAELLTDTESFKIIPASSAMVITGKDLETISPPAWDFVFSHKELVFARTSPEQKLQIVKEAQARGHRVGVTGDGVNDSPALKNADVGIAMNSGSDVARDVSDVVLLNDDFTAIVHGVREGRLIFENLRKAIAYLLSAGSWAEILPVFATFFLGMPQPLSAFLMIIICCLTDMYGGVALMNEPPEGPIMKQPPRDLKNARLLDLKMLFYSYFFYATMMSIGAFYNFFVFMAERGPTGVIPTPIPEFYTGDPSVFPAGYRAGQLLFAWKWGLQPDTDLGKDEIDAANIGSSIFFMTLVVAQMGHIVSIRRKLPYAHEALMGPDRELTYKAIKSFDIAALWRSVQENAALIQWPVIYSWIASVVTVHFFTSIPPIAKVCGTGLIPGRFWGLAIGWSLLWFVCGEIRKWIIVLYPESIVAKTAW